MNSSRRCCLKEDDGGSITYWQCCRRSHPLQQIGGVCAMCLTERLSHIASRGGPPYLTDQFSRRGCPRLAATHSQSVDSAKQVNISVQQYDPTRILGVQEMSARDSSAGSEQSIASLIEREIEEGRQRYSDVTTGSKELAMESSNYDQLIAAPERLKQAQLARSRSYSANSHFNSIQSTPPCCSWQSLRNCGDLCMTSNNSRRYNSSVAMGADVQGRNRDNAVLTKSKSTGSNYNGNNRHGSSWLRSPIHVNWSQLPNFWHKKCIHMERRHNASSTHGNSSSIAQADDSIPFMKLARGCSKNAGAANCMNREMMCMGIKWSAPSSFHLMRRSTSTTGKGATSTCNIRCSSTTQDIAASSILISSAARSSCSPNPQDVCIAAKGVSVCRRRWLHLPNLRIVSRKTASCRASTLDYTPKWSATNHCSTNELPGMRDTLILEDPLSRHQEAGSAGCGAGAHLYNGEEGAENECINGTIVVVDKPDQGACAGAAGVNTIKINHRSTAATDSCSAASTRSNRGAGAGSIRSTTTPTVLYSGHTMMMTQPNIMNELQSIAALVSMDANLIHLV